MEPLVDRLPEDIDALARHLLEEACGRRLRLATAESCTGGLIGAILTDVEGTSHAFERGFIVYSEDAKVGLLGLSRSLIDAEGAVSRPVALAMAEGALAYSPADIALAVTGFAGSAGPEGEPGLVHFACIRRGREAAHREEHFGKQGRTAVRLAAVRVALGMMIDRLD
ncbi:MAG: CinA family protein [Sphingobium sp.]